MIHMINKLPVWDTISLGWSKVHGAKASTWAGLFICFLTMIILGMIGGIADHISVNVGLLVSIIAQIIGNLLIFGLLYLGIKRAYDLPISYRLIFRPLEWSIALKIIGLYLLKMIIYIPALILIMLAELIQIFSHATEIISNPKILPNLLVIQINPSTPIEIALLILSLIGGLTIIYLAVRLALAFAFVLDKGANPWEAIVLSFKATRCNFWRIFGFYILLTLIFFISLIPLGLGAIWTLPLIYICYGLVYKTLSPNTEI